MTRLAFILALLFTAPWQEAEIVDVKDRGRRPDRDLTFLSVLSKSSNGPAYPHSRCCDAGVPPAGFPALVDRAGGGGRRPDAAGALPSFQIQGSAVPRRH